MYELSEGIGSQLINMDKEATGVQGWKRRGGGGGGCKGGGGWEQCTWHVTRTQSRGVEGCFHYHKQLLIATRVWNNCRWWVGNWNGKVHKYLRKIK